MEPGPELGATRAVAPDPPFAGPVVLGDAGPVGSPPPQDLPPASGTEASSDGRDPLGDRHAPRSRLRALIGTVAARLGPFRFAFGVYAATRVLLILVGIIGGALQHWRLTSELANWDGKWYLLLAAHGYPAHAPALSSSLHQLSPHPVPALQTTLGFFPLYPLAIWLVAHLFFCSYVIAGLVVSGVAGLGAIVLVERLCRRWWGDSAARRAVVAMCLFPGSVVFSMVYSEGLLLVLVAGCLLALDDRRFVLGGLLAGAATAVGLDALAIVPACAVASLLEIRRRGWSDRQARRSLSAPLLSPAGLIAVCAYLWAHTGKPLAVVDAQRYAWGERTDAFALWHQGARLAHEISFTRFNYHAINLNYVVGTLGAIYLLVALVLLARGPRRIPGPALAWTLGISFFCVTSEYTPPNPRLLITAFPVVAVMAYRLGRRGFTRFAVANGVLLVVMSAVTYVGIALRP